MLQSTALVSVKNLRYSYGQRVAVGGVSFDVAQGEIFGLLGPNGAGKTTTLSCLAGLLGAFEGELEMKGQRYRPGDSVDDRRRLGLVPQELALYDDLTGRENLVFFGKINGIKGVDLVQAVDKALSLAGLADRAGDRVKEYSGGMKRRLNLAAGDLHSPSLLLLDEPTAGVDPQSRNHIFEALRALRTQGRTIIYTTHYMEEAQRLCDRVAIINEGLIAAIGTARELATGIGKPEADLEDVFLHLTGRSLRDR
jgi:ABC-2 type transport system ATP-binding protein